MLNYAESFQRSVRNELLAELQSGALLMSDGVRDLHTALISCILINVHYGCGASSCSLCVLLATEQTTFLGSVGRSAGAVRARVWRLWVERVSFSWPRSSDSGEH